MLLHALPLDSRMWSRQVKALCPKGNVLAPDLPGFGKAPLAEPSVDAWARRLAASLRAQGFEKTVIAGSSMGGYVALAFLRVAPEMVAGIGLIGSRTGSDSGKQRAARFSLIERIKREGVGPWLSEFVQQALSLWTLEHKPAVVKEVLKFATSQRVDSIIAAQQALAARPDSTDVWVHGPPYVLDRVIIHGVDDKIVPLPEAVELASKSITDFVPLQNGGHLVPLEQPEHVTKAIDELWSQCGRFE